VHFYTSHGVHPSKVILGIPLYGRSFTNTQGINESYSGVGGGTWEPGVYDYRVLPLPGSYVYRNENLGASWTYNHQTKELVSFDNEDVAKWKGEYIKQQGLGGSMFWELSGDKGPQREGMETGYGKDPQPGKSLVKIVKDAMGGISNAHNWLIYDRSKFDNMRKGIPS
jgi:chitinase